MLQQCNYIWVIITSNWMLNFDAQKLCTIVFPWGKNKYKYLPMGIKTFWILMFLKTSHLILSKICNTLRQTCYLDDSLILTNSSFKDHLLKLEKVLAKLSTAGMRVNISIHQNLKSLENK
jgi:hypothetical protein